MNERNKNNTSSPLIGDIGSDQGTKYATSEPESKGPSDTDIFRFPITKDTFTLPVRPHWNVRQLEPDYRSPEVFKCAQQSIQPNTNTQNISNKANTKSSNGIYNAQLVLVTPYITIIRRCINSVISTINHYLDKLY